MLVNSLTAKVWLHMPYIHSYIAANTERDCDSSWFKLIFSGLVKVAAELIFNIRSEILAAAFKKVRFALQFSKKLQGSSKVTCGKNQK